MREFTVPATYTLNSEASMADAVERNGRAYPDTVCFLVPEAKAGWSEITCSMFADQVAALAKGLIALGVGSGDRVALMADTSYEWILFDYAIWRAGAVTVSVYPTSAAGQIGWILQDSGATALIVQNREQRTLAEMSATPRPQILQIEDGAVAYLSRLGVRIPDEDLRSRRQKINSATPAALIYTSGTTGLPKGVPLTHGNLTAMSAAAKERVPELNTPGARTVMFLPMAHILAHTVSLAAFEERVVVAHTSDWTRLSAIFGEVRPTGVVAVPRVFEKLYNTAKQLADDNGRGALFDRATAAAIAYSQALDAGGPSLWLRIQRALFDRLVYRKLRAVLGGQCDHVVSGGAPLGARLAHYFRGVGVNVTEGYGLTETTAAITLNGTQPHTQRIGSVGRPLAGHTVALAEDGELLVRGPVVFAGYWNNEKATAEQFVNGWFCTGDLASIDDDGYVTITGRKKEIIVTAGGKNVSPAPLEDALRSHPLISQAMLVGDAQPFIAALITLDHEVLPGWRERHHLPADTSVTELITHPALYAEIDAAVAEANTQVSQAEQIKKFRILDAEWSQQSGELTPKMSLKRPVILEKYRPDLEALYGAPAPAMR
ncbi:long-chain fatty acid--CoA ligase [Nocardia sp. NPDC050435]|uniref:AMP-dependent synthetase/ligase n=1 Tax=Nocardia sp. NPDC050435 TaxID=3155040 RepID=UPI0033E9D1AE